jgi:hypothetical protein
MTGRLQSLLGTHVFPPFCAAFARSGQDAHPESDFGAQAGAYAGSLPIACRVSVSHGQNYHRNLVGYGQGSFAADILPDILASVTGALRVLPRLRPLLDEVF